MMSYIFKVFAFPLILVTIYANEVSAASARFDETYRYLWGGSHLTRLEEGCEVQLLLDQSSGAGFRSIADYNSGLFRIMMKVPDKNSTGVVPCFYLTSISTVEEQSGPHNEIDFEFFGTGNTLQTNVFTEDSGGREERIELWFDPRKAFHTYEILWNQHQIAFFVDNIPIRVFKNNKNIGVNYPSKPMHIEGSIWNGEWTGQIDWSQAPFIVSYRHFTIDGCTTAQNSSIPIMGCNSPQFYWNNQSELTPFQKTQYENFRRQYLRYSYCSDRSESHPECRIPPV